MSSYFLILEILVLCITCYDATKVPTTTVGFDMLAKTSSKHVEDDVTPSKPQFTDFKDIVNHPSFIDKTNFVKMVVNYTVLLVQAPPRFGRTAVTSMLERFFKIDVDAKGLPKKVQTTANYILFSKKNEYTQDHLAVFKDKAFFEKHFGAYPVVRFDFSTVDFHPWDGTEPRMAEVLSNMLRGIYRQNDYLLFSEKIKPEVKKEFENNMKRTANYLSDIWEMIKVLFDALKTHFNKNPIILIDDFHLPTEKIILSESECEERAMYTLSEFFGQFIQRLVKFNPNFEFAFLTGTTRFGAIFPDNIEQKSIFLDEEFAPYFGLTENEVKELTYRYRQERLQFEPLKALYGGYEVRCSDITSKGNDIRLFSTTSVVESLKTNKMESFCTTKLMSAATKVFRFENLGETIWEVMEQGSLLVRVRGIIDGGQMYRIKKMIAARSVEDFRRNRALMMRCFYENGYFTLADSSNYETAAVSMPNIEVMESFEKTLWKAACGKYKTLQKRVEELASALESLKKDDKVCQRFINRAALLARDLSKVTDAREITAYIFVGIRSGIGHTQHKKTSLEVWVGRWNFPSEEHRVYLDGVDKGSTFLMFLRENPAAKGKQAFTGLFFEVRFSEEPAINTVSDMLTREYIKGFEGSTGVGADYVKEYVYVGLHVSKGGLKVSASILFGGEAIGNAVNVTSQA